MKRLALVFMLFLVVIVTPLFADNFNINWNQVPDRTWVGADLWANRLQDWAISAKALECQNVEFPLRTVQLLTHDLGSGDGQALTRARFVVPSESKAFSTGFLIGSGRGLDYRRAALIHHSPGANFGYYTGIDEKGVLFIKDMEAAGQPVIASQPGGAPLLDGFIEVKVVTEGQSGSVTMNSITPAGETVSVLQANDLPADRLYGQVGLVADRAKIRFTQWQLTGDKVVNHSDRACGPVLSTQYTLHNQILNLTAQLMPVGEKDQRTVALEIQRNGKWIGIANTAIISPGWTATFRVPQWPDDQDIPFRVTYPRSGRKGDEIAPWSGTIRHDPVEKETITVAGFTGNHNAMRGGVDKGKFNWSANTLWFPHNDIVDAVTKHDVDLLFFSGDNVYESASPTFSDHSTIKLDYMYKWYLWCWAYRDLTKEIPVVAIPDDHDVYQGNIWGAGGPPTDVDNKGGYVHPADFVKMVERTQTSNLPKPYDPTPIEQGIGVYYTAFNWGRIGLAVLEDRKFKSGCADLLPFLTRGRPDHINDPDFDITKADVPGLKLLGDRQLTFLHDWTQDWKGQDMKMAMSQTIFAGMATHHGAELFRLIADLDSNGWPQSGRNRAIDALRRGFVFHLGGDQHLASIVHHGIDSWDDAIWSFCVPSVANFYPRAWWPEAEGKNRPQGAPPYLGEHQDGLGNYVTVYGVTNPTSITGESTAVEPLVLHDNMPGYGIVRLNKADRTITMECWPRYVDPADPSTGSQYRFWPKTIQQTDNYDRNPVAFLPEIRVRGVENPVVQIVQESDGEVVYTLRIKGQTFRPGVFKTGNYTIRVSEPDQGVLKELTGIETIGKEEAKSLNVEF